MGALDKIPSLAARQFAKFGTTVIYQTVTQGAYDPATATVSQSVSKQTIKGIVEDYSIGLRMIQQMGSSDAPGTSIREGDKKVTIAAFGFTGVPVNGDKLTVGIDTYAVIGVTTVYASDVVALYALHCRRA